MNDYPTTCAEFVAMVAAQWPVIRQSDKTQERYEDYGNTTLIHRVLRPCGFEIEGTACQEPQFLFTEEHAIRALWFKYMAFTPPTNIEIDLKPVLFVWRWEPETKCLHGIWTAVMRYSCLWRDRNGELYWLDKPKEVG